MAQVALDGVSKVFPDGTVAVRGVDLDIADGELLAVLGPSGCGKTTVLRMVAGFEQPSSGHVRFDGEIVDDVRVQQRELAMLFQESVLYPHLTVEDNLGFPLRVVGVHHRDIAHRVVAVAERLGIADVLDRRPRVLSGGQRQRVALGRAIIRDPSILLMDEPMSNVDAKLRVELRHHLAVLQQRLGVTTMLVTHDQVEAMSLGHRVAVMRAGEVVQCAPPAELYREPIDIGVATFVGAPPMNVVAGVVHSDSDGDVLRIGPHEVGIGAASDRWPTVRTGVQLGVGFRPEDVRFTPDGPIPVELIDAEHVGSHHVVMAALTAPGIRQVAGEPVVHDEPRAIVRGIVAVHAAPDPWRPVNMSLDVDRLELFDLDDGRRLPHRRET